MIYFDTNRVAVATFNLAPKPDFMVFVRSTISTAIFGICRSVSRRRYLPIPCLDEAHIRNGRNTHPCLPISYIRP